MISIYSTTPECERQLSICRKKNKAHPAPAARLQGLNSFPTVSTSCSPSIYSLLPSPTPTEGEGGTQKLRQESQVRMWGRSLCLWAPSHVPSISLASLRSTHFIPLHGLGSGLSLFWPQSLYGLPINWSPCSRADPHCSQGHFSLFFEEDI